MRRRSGPGKVFSALTGFVALVILGAVSKDLFLEGYYLRELRSPENGTALLTAMRRLGEIRSEKAIPDLLRLMEEHDVSHWGERSINWKAAHALMQIGPGGIRSLFENCDHVTLLWKAAYELDDSGKQVAVNVLMEQMSSEADGERWHAVTVLTCPGFGPTVRPALPVLVNALRDDSQLVRISAVLFLADNEVEQIGPEHVVPNLIEAVEHGWAGAHSSAIEILGEIGPEARAAVPTLMRVVETEGEDRPGAARALGRIGKPAKAAIPVLERAMKDDDDELRKRATAALRGIQDGRGRIRLNESLSN